MSPVLRSGLTVGVAHEEWLILQIISDFSVSFWARTHLPIRRRLASCGAAAFLIWSSFQKDRSLYSNVSAASAMFP
jgi:hypothetical protein